MANSPSFYLHNIMGQVSELSHPYKAILTFQYRGKTERALLWGDKLMVDGQNVKYGEPINEHLKLGSTVKFSCHQLNESGQDQCGYFVTMALRQDPIDVFSYDSFRSGTKAFLGIYNANGAVSEVSQRQGVITYVDHDEKEHAVKFLASKLFLFGKRVGAKQSLQTVLSVEDKVQFDAVPCDPIENNSRCHWFATVVWKGKKPMTDYDNPSVDQGKENKSVLSEIKRIPSNPKSMFVRGGGQIMHILNEEYGIALGAMQPNVWEAVLFHRSVCFLFKFNLASQDLGKIFKEGDRVNFIAAKAPKHLSVRWIASQITVYVGSEVGNHDFRFGN